MNKQEYESLKSGDKLKIVSLEHTNVGDGVFDLGEVVEFVEYLLGSSSRNNLLIKKGDDVTWYMSSKDLEVISESESIGDLVNNPKHYATDSSGVECIQIKRKMSANLGDSFKYCWRVGKKWDDKQDLEKALWYINDAIEHDVPVWLDDGVDLETEALIQQVLKHREGWQYMFINALYWSDLEEAKRAVEIGLKEFVDVHHFNK